MNKGKRVRGVPRRSAPNKAKIVTDGVTKPKPRKRKKR